MDGWMDPIGNKHLDFGNEQAPHRGWPRHDILLAEVPYSPSHILLPTLYIRQIFWRIFYEFFSPKPLGSKKLAALSEKRPQNGQKTYLRRIFRRFSREFAHSSRIVYMSGTICRSDLTLQAETAENGRK